VRLSVIVAILNSHEVVRRQLLHWQRMDLPSGVEVLYMDDGSNPPLTKMGIDVPQVTIHPTNDFRPWTQGTARNTGARMAKGDYLLMTDIDYILPRQAIEDALKFSGDRMGFKREFGVLDENGVFTQDLDTLRQYGLPDDRINERGVKISPHPNNFCIRKQLFFQMGGYRQHIESRIGPQAEDRDFKKKWLRLVASGQAKGHDYRPTIYMIPNGRFCGDLDHNPFGLFHGLSRNGNELAHVLPQ